MPSLPERAEGLGVLDPWLQELFAQSTRSVARRLLGCVLVRGPVRLRVVETEAYLPGDSASHAFRGLTRRNAPMWREPGRIYVYRCYGIHDLLNLVTEPAGTPAAVLIRGAEVLAGEELVRARRGGRIDLIGPGKVAQALGLDVAWSGRMLGEGLQVEPGTQPARIQTTPRIGIDYALPRDRAARRRFVAG